MRKIGIVGLGHVGQLLAHQLVTTHRVDSLVLIDQDDKKALAIQTDLEDAQGAFNQHCQIIIQDYAALHDAQVLILAVGKSSLLLDNQMAELAINHDIVRQVAPQIRQSGFQGIILNLADPNEAITAFWQENLLLPPKQVLGMGAVLDTARLRRVVATTAHVATQNVAGFVYGQHNGQQVFAWSTVRVNGQSLDTTINGHHLDQTKLKVNADLANWYTMDGLGYNASAICTWTGRVIDAIFGDEQLALPLAIFQPQYEGYVSFPALIGRHGQGNILLLDLYPVEQAGIKTAATTIKQQLAALHEMNEVEDND